MHIRFCGLLALLLLFHPAPAPVSAQPASSHRPAEREKRVEQQLESIAPPLVPTFRQATVAFDRSDHLEAARLYGEVLKHVPNFTPALRRLGGALVEAGDREAGLTHIERAVQLEATPENLITLADVLMRPVNGQPPSQLVQERALRLAREAAAKYQGWDDSSFLAVASQIALSLERRREFREAAERLEREYPGAMATHYALAFRAAFDGDWIRAEDEIREAARLGLPEEVMRSFLDSGIGRQALLRRAMWWIAYALLAWAAGLWLLWVCGRALSRATLRTIEEAGGEAGISATERRLRTVYRRLITAAGAYYYVSLPFVTLAVVGATALVIYLFLLLGQLPVVLMLSLASGALFTLVKMVQSLFIRVDRTDPGRTLPLREAPALWALTREVAERVGTRPVDEIRITPGTELAVYERGTRRERARDQGDRVLLLGIGLLHDFAQAPFCAVLAHEYGHFSHRDTAGGDVALRVQNDMMKFALAMVQGGQGLWYNLAFQFLRLYSFLFRRISHGAARLQEVLADRVAASHYGPADFETGLRHVVRRQIELGLVTSAEIQAALQASRPLRNFYDMRPDTDAAVEEALRSALDPPLDEDNTHPPAVERFRLVSRIAPHSADGPSGAVWDLFANREGLTHEMLAVVSARLSSAPEPEALSA